jgi:hypothetical protein
MNVRATSIMSRKSVSGQSFSDPSFACFHGNVSRLIFTICARRLQKKSEGVRLSAFKLRSSAASASTMSSTDSAIYSLITFVLFRFSLLLTPRVILTLLSFLKSAKFTDYAIRCGQYTFKVHRIIISSRSEYFETACSSVGFRESSENSISLPEDEPILIARMLLHMYASDYLE